MCKRLAAGLLLLSFALLAPSAAAHPGRTDSDGGHFNRTTGQYHWHHGYSEHQHYDMDGDGKKDCPLTFKGSTVSKSGSTSKPTASSKSSNSSASSGKSFFSIFSSGTSAKTTAPSTQVQPISSSSASSGSTTLSYTTGTTSGGDAIPLLLFVFGAPTLLFVVIKRIDQTDERKKEKSRNVAPPIASPQVKLPVRPDPPAIPPGVFVRQQEIQDAVDTARQELSAQFDQEKEALLSQFDQEKKILTSRFEQEQAALTAQFDRERANLQKQLEGKQLALQLSAAKRRKLLSVMEETYGKNFLLRAAGAPVSVYFDPKGYPRLSPNINDDPYILHRSATGKYHRWGCQHYYSCTPVHALDVSPTDFRHCSCMVCCPKYPDFAWVDRLNRLVDLTKD